MAVRMLVAVLVLALAGASAALGGQAREPSAPPARTAPPPRPAPPDPPPPRPRPKLVEPEAGVALAEPVDVPAGGHRAPKRRVRRGRPEPAAMAAGISGAGATRATALPNGVALPPLEAPEAVMEVIRAGNSIARSPYKWGGGHGNFLDDGYDCSGSVTFALYSAGLIAGSATSGQLMSYGKPGKGRWITLYTNDGHVFMEVAGIRFDTSAAKRTGSRWTNERRPTTGYVARHPPGF